ncbi:4-carboxymuconolactone decarboxylase [Nocardioides sp. YIM 152315]|uniref:bifunctional 3-oxoadipate enol-lactonase/4-carboxymuconolactone decarboxylase PcaDC n=1 Tax=Nocardioides sp. YIM 152315 TaxID=3031760 RepID=UPI0023D9B32F|nr:4-carboxymuconolactone decarboxylase [Nocardioides sp. YIM 152315]MDF1605330.1 4-carboxymuconolactone decarboxylase [Nocardioides sp. YIM 152315]
MIPGITVVRLTGGRDRAALPLLVLGPSLGTSAATLWSACTTGLTDDFDVVAWDLPGHGHNRSVPEEPFTIAELAAGVLRVVDDVMTERGQPRGPFFYAGDSVGGSVGLQLMLDASDRVVAAALLCTGAQIGTPETWTERIATVRASGTPVMVSGSAERWFGPGFLEREPERGGALLRALSDADAEGYVQVCAAIADFDVRARLDRITAPVLAIAGAEDVTTPPDTLREIAAGVADGSYVELAGTAHLAPAEQPAEVARLLRAHFLGEAPPAPAPSGPAPSGHAPSEGMRVRREVLGDAHVDRAVAGTTDFTRDFQELITAYAWGEIWTRPGLDRRSRSMITLTALVARGHHEELAMHVRAALRNGLSVGEIKEVLLQSAIYCGVPDANTAFRVASGVLREEGLL